MNAQELYLDIASGRFLDGESLIATAKPVFYSNESVRVSLNLYEIKQNTKVPVTKSANSTLYLRLGNTENKLADGIAAATLPIYPIQAQASIVTAPSKAPVASVVLENLSPVTASLSLTIASYSLVTGTFITKTSYTAPVTAQINAFIASSFYPAITKSIPLSSVPITNFVRPGSQTNSVLSMSATLNSPYAASFISTISSGSILNLSILDGGLGYPDGTYDLVIGGPNPTRSIVSPTISGGSINNITISNAGAGYSTATYSITFSSGDAEAYAQAYNGVIQSITIVTGGSGYVTAPLATIPTPSVVTAVASAVATLGQIRSVVINNYGQGYASNPSISLFSPKYSVSDLTANLQVALKNADGSRNINWVSAPTGTAVGITFSAPPQSGSVTLPVHSAPSAFLIASNNKGSWVMKLVSSGYGYTTAPTMGHNSFFAYAKGLSTTIATVPGATKAAFIPSPANTIFTNELRDTKAFPRVKNYDLAESLIEVNNGSIIIGNLGIFYYQGQQPWMPNPVEQTPWDYGVCGTYTEYNASTRTTTKKKTGWLRCPKDAFGIDAFKLANFLTIKPDNVDPISPYVSQQILNTKALNESIPIFIGPVNTGIKDTPLYDPRHDLFAGKSFLAALVPNDKNYQPTRYAVVRITCPNITNDYVFITKNTAKTASYYSESINGYFKSPVPSQWGYVSYSGGGILEPQIEILDYGEGYAPESIKNAEMMAFLPLTESVAPILQSPFDRNISITTSLQGNYLSTKFSVFPTVASRTGQNGVEFFVKSGGNGFIGDGTLSVSSATILGGVVSAAVVGTAPAGYLNDSYTCSVQSPPSGGSAAIINLVVEQGKARAVVLNSGSGFTSVPIVTAPSPNQQTGQITSLVAVTKPMGYSLNTKHYLSVAPSPVSGGDAVVGFEITSNGISTFIENSGYGYIKDAVATAFDPDLRQYDSYVSAVNINNTPAGYRIGAEYPISIQPSAVTGGNASVIFKRLDSDNYTTIIINPGYGFTSTPIVTAPAPDLLGGNINYVSVVCLGVGYPPGSYNCNISSPSQGGQPASINFIVDSESSQRFTVNDSGSGYFTTPNVSVITPSGNIISSITIVCEGKSYTAESTVVTISDSRGAGAVLLPNVIGGKIKSVTVVSSGYNFYNKPAIQFNLPDVIQPITVASNQILADFTITTASANAILGNEIKKDIILEVYETDGATEQVLAQANVTLAKRVAS